MKIGEAEKYEKIIGQIEGKISIITDYVRSGMGSEDCTDLELQSVFDYLEYLKRSINKTLSNN